MKLLVLTPLLSLFFVVRCAVYELHGRPARHLSTLSKRASLTGGGTGLTDTSNLGYYLNITLGGQDFEVQIDTGSSDLYVAGTVPNSNSTGKTGGVTYAVGAASGNITTASMVFLGYTVEDQAFINIEANSVNQTAGTGLIGLGPHTGSDVQLTLGNGTGDPPLDRIFQQNTSSPNYVTVLLGRVGDKFDTLQGNFTIEEVLSGYENITSQPHLNVTVLPETEDEGQHWQVLLDADGIIGPNDEVVDVTTGVSSTSNDKQLTVVFDTGYSIAQVPSAVATAFYQNVPDAEYIYSADLDGNIWQIPCEYEINVTFIFGGINYTVNPIDTSLDLGANNSKGEKVCYGGFQPIEAAESDLYDIIFGMSFLRNVYMLIDFGDFADNATTRLDPYVQLLSLNTNATAMHDDFVSLRGSASWDPNKTNVSSWISTHLKIVIPVVVVGGLLLLGALFMCVRVARRRRMARTPAGFMNFKSSYQALNEPAPQEAHDLRLMGAPAHQQGYASPWDSRY